jgi:hypothetical protein
MAFHVPEIQGGLFEEVERRFRLLLGKNIVTGVSETQFDKWLSNLLTEEDRYLAARLLQNLTFRSERMVGCAIDHILQCILPGELRRQGIQIASVDEFLKSLKRGNQGLPLRFVEVDDPKGNKPGKSGAVLMRELHRLGGVNSSLTCLSSAIDHQPSGVKCLVFIDDMLGTGTQMEDYSLAHHLKTVSAKHHLIYCPLAAFESGLAHLGEQCPWLQVCPVEVFGPAHQFFRCEAERPLIWAIDHTNTVADVRAHMDKLCKRGGIGSPAAFNLELLVGFHHATPNNTLAIMHASSPKWHNLLTR